MKKQHIEYDEEAICINCVNSKPLEGGDVCICRLCGAVKADGTCKKFRMDLLKIEPKTLKLFAPQGE